MMRPFIPRAPIVMAAIIGTFAGTVAVAGLLLAFADGPLEETISTIGSLLLFTGLLVPISAFAILIFGYPAAAAVGEAWDRAWVGLAALLMGALAGFITRVTMVSLFAGGFARGAGEAPLPVDPGIVYGACVGLAYWLFERDYRLRAEAQRRDETVEEVPSSEEFARLP